MEINQIRTPLHLRICIPIAEKLQDIFTKSWKGHTPAIPLVDSDGLPDNPPRLPNIGQVKKLLKD